jgi:D-lactate dehydrogenase (cytochrome)
MRLISLFPAEMMIEISKREGESLGIFASIVGHLGDGNFHEAIMVNKKDPIEFAAVEKAVHNMVDRALEMEGTCTVIYSCFVVEHMLISD